MPLFQYIGWVGSFLVAALFAANWCCSAPIRPAPRSNIPLNQNINIRIHTNQKWPERVVFDTTRSTLAQKADAQTDVGGSESPVLPEHQRFDAFAEMAAIPARPCFRPPCFVGRAAGRNASPIEKGAASQDRSRLSRTARKRLTFPNPLHKPPGRS
jgi:hypothetical protein